MNQDHICIRSENCESLPKDIKNKMYPEICSFDSFKPIVCCSPTILDHQSENQKKDIVNKSMLRVTCFYNYLY